MADRRRQRRFVSAVNDRQPASRIVACADVLFVGVSLRQFFCDWLGESASDFRVEDSFLSRVSFGVFGLGSSLYEQHYNAVAKRVCRTNQLIRSSGTRCRQPHTAHSARVCLLLVSCTLI